MSAPSQPAVDAAKLIIAQQVWTWQRGTEMENFGALMGHIQEAVDAETALLKEQISEWRRIAVNYAKGQPTSADVTSVGLALLNDAIDADKVNKITEAKTI